MEIKLTSWLMVMFSLFSVGCTEKSQLFDQLTASTSSLSGYVVVTTTTTAQTTAAVPVGPGVVSLFDNTGKFVSIVQDYFSSSEFGNGLALVPPYSLYVGIEGTDRINKINLNTSVASSITNPNITSAPLRQMTSDSAGNVYIIEGSTNTIEKIDADGTRVGSPWVNTTTTTGANTCTLNTPFGITYVPNSDYIVVSQFRTSAATMVVYDTQGNCIRSVATAPYSTNFPTAIAWHSSTSKLIVARMGDHSLYSTNLDGTGSALAYLNSTRINTPTSIAVDASGYVYVGSSGTDTIEKMSFSGSTLTPVASSPFINMHVGVVNPTAIVVIP